jgi:hypothetical protein
MHPQNENQKLATLMAGPGLIGSLIIGGTMGYYNGMNPQRGWKKKPSGWAAIAVFLVVTFSLSWLAMAALHPFLAGAVNTGSAATRVFRAALFYVAAMGWQPMVATLLVRRLWPVAGGLDDGLRPTQPKFLIAGGAAAATLVLAASALALLAASGDGSGPVSTEGVKAGLAAASGIGRLEMFGLGAGALLMIWLQAFTEEAGWRGEFLARLMKTAGPWKGLLLHGVAWGVWYAPVVLVFSGEMDTPALATAMFIVTCVLLGVLLGWLRLAAASVVPAVVANVVVTVGTGLPYYLSSSDGNVVQGAVFGPLGWCLMLAVVLALGLTRWRSAVRLPVAHAASGANAARRLRFLVDGRLWVERGAERTG